MLNKVYKIGRNVADNFKKTMQCKLLLMITCTNGTLEPYLKLSNSSSYLFFSPNLPDLQSAITAYKKRFNFEEIICDFKSRGYQLEDTNVSSSRLIFLILLISFAYTLATFQGQKIKRTGVQKYVGRIKEYGRVTRRNSSFYVGLYSQTWIHFRESCWAIVQGLMKLNRNKLPDYLRGLRAMELIMSTS